MAHKTVGTSKSELHKVKQEAGNAAGSQCCKPPFLTELWRRIRRQHILPARLYWHPQTQLFQDSCSAFSSHTEPLFCLQHTCTHHTKSTRKLACCRLTEFSILPAVAVTGSTSNGFMSLIPPTDGHFLPFSYCLEDQVQSFRPQNVPVTLKI